MADDDVKPSGARADDDVKPSGARTDGDDVKPSGARTGDLTAGGATSPGGSMAGAWGVVAFFGPVGLNVPEMALRSLRSAVGNTARTRRSNALANLYAISQSVDRQRTIRDAAEKIAKEQQRSIALLKGAQLIKSTALPLIAGKTYVRRSGKKTGPRNKKKTGPRKKG